jgi:hypothetical protein
MGGGLIKSRMRWAGHIALMGEMRNAYKSLVRNLKGRDHMYLGEIKWEGVDSIHMSQDRYQ